MTRRAKHLASLTPREAPAPFERLLTISELAECLHVSRSKIERDVSDGMPHLDVGRHDPRRRRKRSLRFDIEKVIAWLRERNR